MSDKELLAEEIEEGQVQDNDTQVAQKPPVVFEDEFEIITDDDELEPEDGDDDNAPPVDVGVTVAQAIQAQTGGNEKLAAVLEQLEKSLAPKKEPVKPVNLEEEAEKIAEKLTEDPKAAIRELTQLIAGNVGGALQYQNGQIRQTQAAASKIIAKGNDEYRLVFERWDDEVDQAAKSLLQNGQLDANTVYVQAAQQVMMAHMSEVIALKAEEIASGRSSAAVKKQKVAKHPGTPPVEGQRKKAVYKFSPADKAWADRQLNPSRAYQKLIKDGRAVKVR